MKHVAMVAGILLIIVGFVGYGMPDVVVTDGPEGETVEKIRSWTALIPALIGLPIFLCGLWAVVQPAANMVAMHVAVTFALLGALAATFRASGSLLALIRADGDFNQRAFAFLSLTGVLCWMVVLIFGRSFMNARKARKASEASDTAPT